MSKLFVVRLFILTLLVSLWIGSGAQAAVLLKVGSRGTEVRQLQTRLQTLGYNPGKADGIYGSNTRTAVIRFQQANGLKADGIAGSLTLGKLYGNVTPPSNTGGSSTAPSQGVATSISRTLRYGYRGEDVRALQQRLTALGYKLGKADGIFGGNTRTAVIAFQRANGLAADGIVGKLTLARLFPIGTTQPKPTTPPAPTPNPPPASTSVWKPSKGKINMTWDNQPSSLTLGASGVDAVAPVWFVIFKQNNQIMLSSGRASKAYVESAHSKGYKVFGTIQSFTPEYSREVVKNPEVGNRIIANMVEHVNTYQLDGINIDFENMIPADKAYFTEFVRKLTAEMKKRDKVVTLDVTLAPSDPNSNNYWSACYDRKALAGIVDYMMVMAYDEYYSTSPVNGPGASLDWVDYVIRKSLQEIPAQKLILGIPLYSYDWISVPSAQDPSKYIRQNQASALGMAQIKDLVNNGRFTKSGATTYVKQWIKYEWLENEGVSYLKFIDTENRIHEIWAEDHKALSKKLDLVAKYNLPGISTWQQLFGDTEAWRLMAEKMGK